MRLRRPGRRVRQPGLPATRGGIALSLLEPARTAGVFCLSAATSAERALRRLFSLAEEREDCSHRFSATPLMGRQPHRRVGARTHLARWKRIAVAHRFGFWACEIVVENAACRTNRRWVRAPTLRFGGKCHKKDDLFGCARVCPAVCWPHVRVSAELRGGGHILLHRRDESPSADSHKRRRSGRPATGISRSSRPSPLRGDGDRCFCPIISTRFGRCWKG